MNSRENWLSQVETICARDSQGTVIVSVLAIVAVVCRTAASRNAVGSPSARRLDRLNAYLIHALKFSSFSARTPSTHIGPCPRTSAAP